METNSSDSPPHEHVVHEAFGPPLSPRQATAAIALGVISLLISGVLSVLLGALAEEHRLSARGIGLSAMTEALTMALTTGLAGAVLKPHKLRWIGAGAALALAAADLAIVWTHNDVGVMTVRAIAGVPEGLLLWITIGMIARTETPDRWAGVMFTAGVATQLVIAGAFALLVLPRFGGNGGFTLLAAACLSGVLFALWLPDHYPALSQAAGETGAPPARGWVSLGATLLFVSANSAVAVYLQPLAAQAGLPASVVRVAVSLSLAAQVIGAAMATLAAGRINWFTVFAATMASYFAIYSVYGFSAPAWMFLAATAFGGLVTLFMYPFMVPMTIEVDPSRRTAVQSGAAQLLGAALGPLLAALVVRDHDVRGVLGMAAALLAAGLAIFAALRFTRPRTTT